MKAEYIKESHKDIIQDQYNRQSAFHFISKGFEKTDFTVYFFRIVYCNDTRGAYYSKCYVPVLDREFISEDGLSSYFEMQQAIEAYLKAKYNKVYPEARIIQTPVFYLNEYKILKDPNFN